MQQYTITIHPCLKYSYKGYVTCNVYWVDTVYVQNNKPTEIRKGRFYYLKKNMPKTTAFCAIEIKLALLDKQ